jgi:hypothetical protein
MTPEHWRRVEDIFQAALDLNAEERARYMSVACGEDAALRRDVEHLLLQHEVEQGQPSTSVETFSIQLRS